MVPPQCGVKRRPELAAVLAAMWVRSSATATGSCVGSPTALLARCRRPRMPEPPGGHPRADPCGRDQVSASWFPDEPSRPESVGGLGGGYVLPSSLGCHPRVPLRSGRGACGAGRVRLGLAVMILLPLLSVAPRVRRGRRRTRSRRSHCPAAISRDWSPAAGRTTRHGSTIVPLGTGRH